MDERERGASTERRSSLSNRGAAETLGLGEQRAPPFHHAVGERSPGSQLGGGVPYELGRLTASVLWASLSPAIVARMALMCCQDARAEGGWRDGEPTG
jgi:hypothetical protein